MRKLIGAPLVFWLAFISPMSTISQTKAEAAELTKLESAAQRLSQLS